MGLESIVSGGGSIINGIIGANTANKAAGKASNAELQAAQMNDALARQLFNVGTAQGAPYREAGYSALAGLMDMMGLSRAFTGTPTGATGTGGTATTGGTPGRVTAQGMTGPGANTGEQYIPSAPRQWQGTADQWRAFVQKWYENPADFSTNQGRYWNNPGSAIGMNNADANSLYGLSAKSWGKIISDATKGGVSGGTPLSIPNLGQGSEILASKPAYNWQMDPGYQFRMDEGQRALENSAAARGGLLSGGTAKAIEQYGQGFASNEYANVFNRLATLAGVSAGGVGTNNAGSVAALGGAAANSVANAGAIRAGGYIGAGNSYMNMTSGLTGNTDFLSTIFSGMK